MTLTPDQGRVRLSMARDKMRFATTLANAMPDREGFDVQVGLTKALLEVIELLEDALA